MIRTIHMFDIDATITTLDGIVDVVQELYPNFKEEHLIDYDVRNSLIKSGFIDEESDFNTYELMRKHPLMFLDGEPREWIKEYLEAIVDAQEEVQFVTARYYTNKRYNHTLSWSNKHFPTVPISKSNLHFMKANHKAYHAIKPLLDANKNKVETKVILYEDKVENLQETLELYNKMDNLLNISEYGTLELYKVHTPYNAHYTPKEVKTIKSWKELIK